MSIDVYELIIEVQKSVTTSGKADDLEGNPHNALSALGTLGVSLGRSSPERVKFTFQTKPGKVTDTSGDAVSTEEDGGSIPMKFTFRVGESSERTRSNPRYLGVRTVLKSNVIPLGLPEVRGDYIRVRLAGSQQDLSAVVKSIRGNSPVKVIRFGPFKKNQQAAFSKLTVVQLRILTLAYSLGYYDIPRRTSTSELAKLLGVHKGTLGDHLRRAEKNVFSELLR